MNLTKDFEFQRNWLLFNSAIPILMLSYDFYFGQLGANPPEAIIRTTGVVSIIFLVLTLAVTPMAQIFNWPWINRHRRNLGLAAFYYALVHLLAYSVFDKALKFADIAKDIVKRPFILLGFTAFLMMIPLAVTSTNEMIRKLGGKNWKRLHKFTYPIAVIAAIHYWLIVKSDLRYPILFAFAFALLLGYRVIKSQSKKANGAN